MEKTIKTIGYLLMILPVPLSLLSSHYWNLPPEVGRLSDPIQWIAGIALAIPIFIGILIISFRPNY